MRAISVFLSLLVFAGTSFASTRHLASEADEEQPVAQEQQSVAQEQQPVAQEQQPVAQEQQPVAQERQLVAQEQQPIAQEQQPIAQELQKPKTYDRPTWELQPICKETRFDLAAGRDIKLTILKAVVTRDIVLPANENEIRNGWLGRIVIYRQFATTYDDVIPAGTELELEMHTDGVSAFESPASFRILGNNRPFDAIYFPRFASRNSYIEARKLMMGEVIRKLRSHHIDLLDIGVDLRCRD